MLITNVTYMEMREAPSFTPQLREDITLSCERLSLEDYKNIFRAVGQNWLWFGRLALPEEQLSALLKGDDIELYVMRNAADQTFIGMAEIDFSNPKHVELVYFGVTQEYLGQGLGRYLMENVLEIVWSRNPDALLLNTNDLDHSGARKFYRQAGFREIRTQKERFPDPRCVGLLPQDAAPDIPLNFDATKTSYTNESQ